MSPERRFYPNQNRLTGRDGRVWIGDESSGFWENELPKKQPELVEKKGEEVNQTEDA